MLGIYLEEHSLYYIWKIHYTYYEEQFIVIRLEEEESLFMFQSIPNTTIPLGNPRAFDQNFYLGEGQGFDKGRAFDLKIN